MLATYAMVFELLWAIQTAKGVAFATNIADHGAFISVTMQPFKHPPGSISTHEFQLCLVQMIFPRYTMLPCVKLPLLVLRGEGQVIYIVRVRILSIATRLGRRIPYQFVRILLAHPLS